MSAYKLNTDTPTDTVFITPRQKQEHNSKEDTMNNFKTSQVKNSLEISSMESQTKTLFQNKSLSRTIRLTQSGATQIMITKPKELISTILSEIQPVPKKVVAASFPPRELHRSQQNQSAGLTIMANKIASNKPIATSYDHKKLITDLFKRPYKKPLEHMEHNTGLKLVSVPNVLTGIPSASYLSNIPLSDYGTLYSDSSKHLIASGVEKSNQMQSSNPKEMNLKVMKDKELNETYSRMIGYSKPFSNNTLQRPNSLLAYQNMLNFYRPQLRYYMQSFNRPIYIAGTPAVQPLNYIPGMYIQPAIYNSYYYWNKLFRRQYS